MGLEEGRDHVGGLVGHREEDDGLALERVDQAVRARDAGDARGAPRRPELEEDDLPLEAREALDLGDRGVEDLGDLELGGFRRGRGGGSGEEDAEGELEHSRILA